MKLRKVIWEGHEIPTGYGIAWLKSPSFDAVCYPIPLNILLRYLRTIWHFCVKPNEGALKWWHEGFEEGYDAGHKQGYKDAIEVCRVIRDLDSQKTSSGFPPVELPRK